MPNQLFDIAGKTISLVREFGRGGEGALFETSDPGVAAKVFHDDPVDLEKVEKLKVMAQGATPELLRVAAWPTNTLYSRPGGSLRGILLPRVVGHREIHQLYSPIQRRMHFPNRDWSFLIHVAMNCAAAVETVHANGHIIGDLNQGGFLASPQGTVRLIDCDSFQVRSGNRVFRCVVGVPHYTPPELQGLDFRTVDRTESHDCFGLALLIFHLLFMGRHPFAGRFLGSGDMPIEQAISSGHFAFSRFAATFQMGPPPHALALDEVTSKLADLFEQAFTVHGNSFRRPSAHEWREALAKTKNDLAKCKVDPSHIYPTNANQCPWCRIEHEGGFAFFTSSLASFTFDESFDLRAVWLRIQGTARPPGPFALVMLRPSMVVAPMPYAADACWHHLGGPKAFPPTPKYEEIPLPPIPDFMPETFPEDPIFRPEHLPPIPEFDDQALLRETRSIHRQSLKFGDYRAAKWGTLVFSLIAVAFSWYFPVLIVAAVLAIPFGITWAIYYFPARKKFRKACTNAIALTKARRKEWDAVVKRTEERRREIEVHNQQRQTEWKRQVERLDQQRREASDREPHRRELWAIEVRRIENQRVLITDQNVRRKDIWLKKMEVYELEKRAIERHNDLISMAMARREAERNQRQAKLRTQLDHFENLKRSWINESRGYEAEFELALGQLAQFKAEYEGLRQDFERERQQLSADQREVQLRDYLRSALVEDARISGIGVKRKATLAAYGIEAAFDITADSVSNVPGFGVQTISELLAWKSEVAQTFRFDAQKATSPTELRSLHMRYSVRRVAMQKKLLNGEELLREIAKRGEERLKSFNSRALVFLRAAAQAEADMDAI